MRSIRFRELDREAIQYREACGARRIGRLRVEATATTIRNADQILVMRHGQIVERGTHDESLELNGKIYGIAPEAFMAQIRTTFGLKTILPNGPAK